MKRLTRWWPRRESKTTGQRAEDLAARYLKRRFYRIEARNFRCRTGEVDIVARRRNMLVFVEVRSRTEPSLLNPLETLDRKKMRRIASAARVYLHINGLHRHRARFDVIGILYPASERHPVIIHIISAFSGDDLEEQKRRI